jgi:hypothetical protein
VQVTLNKSIPNKILQFGHLTVLNLPHLSHETALQLAEQVLPIFENEYPNDNRPRQVITTARRYLADPTKENYKEMFQAADIAYRAISHEHILYWTIDFIRNYCLFYTTERYITNIAYWVACAINIDQKAVNLSDTALKLFQSNSWVQL